MKSWHELSFWNSEEWKRVHERLTEEEDNICPCFDDLFLSMELTPLQEVRCAIICQDPYPNPALAMGLAMSVPDIVKLAIPPTLRTVFNEYVSDLHFTYPTTTNLTPWAKQGVFLWNAIPSCRQWQSMSHDWEEWHALTKEIVEELDKRGVVFAFLGSVARRFTDYTTPSSESICLSHPSPRGSLHSYNPFVGARLFSTINDLLGCSKIDWKLP
jgi:uracil-DNA glycosylase